MKNSILLLLLLGATNLFGQEITPEASQATQLDEHGNYINNITDKQGLKQGDWFYVDIHGKQVVKKFMADNEVQNTALSVNNEWLDVSGLDRKSELEKTLAAELKNNGILLTENRQLLLVLNEKGQVISTALLGKWTKDEEPQVTQLLESYLQENSQTSDKKYYILL